MVKDCLHVEIVLRARSHGLVDNNSKSPSN